MIIWGMSRNSHDWAIAIFKDKNLIRIVSGKGLKHTLKAVRDAKQEGEPDLVIWYENPYLKAMQNGTGASKAVCSTVPY